MKARAIVVIFLAIAVASSVSLAADTPFGLAEELTSYGFPSSLLQSSFSGFPSGYLEPSTPYSTPDAIFSFANAFMPMDLGPMGDYPSYFPGSSSFGFPAMSGLSDFISPAFSSTPMGFPEISGMIDQPLQGSFSQADSGLTPSADAYTEANNGQTIHVKLGDTICVQLDSRLGLGYIWNLSVTGGLNITSSRVYMPQDLSNDIASGTIELLSTQEWNIKAIKAGTQVINATYSQSEPGPGDRTFILTVIVE
jgi:inhibitor of cysteine peptidase